VNASGTGSYTQSSLPTTTPAVTGTGTVKVSGGTITVAASGKNLALLGHLTPSFGTFTETAPPPITTGTFTLAT
jgi:hypothetical protein